jgi:hypothetical protein
VYYNNILLHADYRLQLYSYGIYTNSFFTHFFPCQREIMASQSSVQLPVIAFLGYGITNGYWIGSTRYVFEDMCHALLYLYIYTERY